MSVSRRRLSSARGTFLAAALATSVASLAASATAQGELSRTGSPVPASLRRAAATSAGADRRLVAAAGALKLCVKADPSYPGACSAARLAVQRAGSALAGAESNFAVIARRTAGHSPRATAARTKLRIHGYTLAWTRVTKVRKYVLSRKVRGQGEADVLVTGTSTTPPPVPGATVSYSVRAAVSGGTWSAVQSITYPPSASAAASEASAGSTSASGSVDTQAAPAITVSGQTVSWNAVGDVSTYVIETLAPGRAPQYSEVTGTSYTPTPVAGTTIGFYVRTAVDGSAWSPEATISFPAESPVSAEAALTGPKIIGANDGAGWGPGAAATIIGGHITWNRVEIGARSNTLAQSVSDGFHNLAIVGNIEDETPLSQVNPSSWGETVAAQLRENPGISIAEAGNEMYLKGGAANPVRYGEMYLAAVNDIRAEGISTPLLFNMTGDVPTGTWSSPTGWSQDVNGGGWLRDAVKGVPGLAAAIRANGVSVHPYGELEEDKEDSAGVRAVPAEEGVARQVLGSTPAFYITEFGYSLSACGHADGACSQEEQAAKMRAAYQAFLADPHVAGIWAYESHDDPTGAFGFMNNNGTTRPLFGVLSSFAIEQAQ